MRIRFSTIAALAVLLMASGCELDLANPNAPTEEEVLPDADGIIALAVGLQNIYAGSVETYVRAPALVTDEWGLKAAALPSDESLLTGDGIDPGYNVVSAPYAVTYDVIRSANLLIENAPQAERLGNGTKGGIVALSKLFKAMALGSAILQFEEIAIDAAVEGAVPQPRAVVFDTILSLLEDARSDYAAASAEDLATFEGRALASNLDLGNTIDAMLARYYLIDGQYQTAIDAADRVDLSVLSFFDYPNPDINPLYNYAIAAGYTAPLRSFVDQAEDGDQRVEFWTVTDPEEAFIGQPDSVLTPHSMYSERNDSYPIYLPDEMRLIQAEAYTRLGDFDTARGLINAVRTDCATGTQQPIACLPALPESALDTEAELLSQIAYERRYELYLQALRWEDMRRLDDYIDHEPVIEFLPFPISECQVNPNVNC